MTDVFIDTRHIGIGGRSLTAEMCSIFASMKEVHVLDLREGPDLTEILWREEPVCFQQLKELWIRTSDIPHLRQITWVRKADGFPVKKVICERSDEEGPASRAPIQWAISGMCQVVGSFVEQDSSPEFPIQSVQPIFSQV
jgi:hypothetical protein